MIKAHNLHKMTCHLAGRQYHDADLVWDYLRVGKEVRLERDIDNPHDSYAVAVIFEKDGEDYLIGYLPRGENKEMAEMLEMGWGCCYRTVISSINPETSPEHQVHLTISIRRNNMEKAPEKGSKKSK